MLGHGPRTTFNAGPGLRSGYLRGSGFLSFILVLYPLGWALSEGGNVISSTSEMVWYGVLDLVLGPLFLFYVIFGIRNIDYNTFGLQSWKYSDTYGALPATGVAAPAAVLATVNPGAGYGSTRYPKAAEAGVAPVAPLSTASPVDVVAPATTTSVPVVTSGVATQTSAV